LPPLVVAFVAVGDLSDLPPQPSRSKPAAIERQLELFIKKKSRAKDFPARRAGDTPKTIGKQSYFFSGGGAGAGGGVGVAGCTFVAAGVLDSSLLHPVSIAPITRPSSTIRVDILFIVR